jgi:hypothetical protein
LGKTPCWENCWDFFSKVPRHGHGLLLVIGGQMHVAHSHCNIFMTHEGLHGWQVHTSHDQPTGKTVS